MIESLTIQNFESYKDTTLEFTSGLNVFVGESDRGKSGSFRAYEWLTENGPGGDWMFPMFWEGTSKVTAVFSDPDVTIQRIKSKSKNYYVLNDQEPINAGTSVPNEIAELIDVDSVNLQTQIDRAFLMFETPGERGRILNKIAGLDEIETTLSNAKRDVNKLKGHWESEKEKVEKLKEELDQFSFLEEMEERLYGLDLMETLLYRSTSKTNTLKKLIVSVNDIDIKIAEKQPFVEAEKRLLSIQEKQKEFERNQEKINSLKKIARMYFRIQEKESAENFEGIEVKIESVKSKMEELKQSKSKIDKYKKIKARWESVTKQVEVVTVALKELESKIPNICTECGREL